MECDATARYLLGLFWFGSGFIHFAGLSYIKCVARELLYTGMIQGLYSLSAKTSYCKMSWGDAKPLDSLLEFSNRSQICCAAEMAVNFESDVITITSNLAASRLHEIWR